MIDINLTLANLRRPKLLVRAARSGIKDYRRETYAKRIPAMAQQSGNQLLETLIAEENRLDEFRRDCIADYSIRKHVMVLTALLAEASQPVAPVLEYKMAA